MLQPKVLFPSTINVSSLKENGKKKLKERNKTELQLTENIEIKTDVMNSHPGGH